MKKIKLLTPIISTALITATAIPLAACSKPAVEPIDREIQIDSSIANTVEVIKKELTSDGDLSIKLQEKTNYAIEKLTSVHVGATTLDATLYTFVNNVLTIKKSAFDAAGKITIVFDVVDAVEVELKLSGELYPFKATHSLEVGKTYKFTVKYEVNWGRSDIEFNIEYESGYPDVIEDGSFRCVTTDSTPLFFWKRKESYYCDNLNYSEKQTITVTCRFTKNMPNNPIIWFTISS